jgi:TPR repeat protein
MALDAERGGSIRALSVLGWDLVMGKLIQQDFPRGMDYLRRGAAAGDPKAMRYFGTANLAVRRIAAAEYWILDAAYRGEPGGLLFLAAAEESGSLTGTPDFAAACRYYYLAYVYGYRDARIHLQQLADRGAPGAERYNSLVIIWRAAHGHRSLSNDSVARAAAYLESSFPADPEVLDGLGLLYDNGYEKGFMDFKKAMALFEKAVALGSQDARSHRARAMADGIGCRKDPAAALAEWRALERQDNAAALACLGYYSFWGSLEGAGLGKNAFLAYDYSRRAAEAGDPFGAANLAACYADGIGVGRNYVLAAEYYRVALNCHVLAEGYARRMVDRCLAFAE